VARATLLSAMIYAQFVLFNYRLIVAKFLIYDLIAMTNASPSATHVAPSFFPGNVSSHDLWSPPTLMTMMERADDSTPFSSTSASESLGTSSQLLHRRWQRVLSRPKRYLSFPEGSSLSVCPSSPNPPPS